MPEPVISVVVSTYQRAQRLPRLVEALRQQEGVGSYEFIIVDNGSTDDTAEVMAKLEAEGGGNGELRVLRIEENRGPAPARNAGWRAARAPLVAFTDDDCEPRGTWLAATVAAFEAGADVVQGRTVPDPDGKAGPFSHTVSVAHGTIAYETCNIAYRRELLAQLDGFDETFRGASFGDDTDLGWRAKKTGADVRFQRDAVVAHEVTPSDYRAYLRARARRVGMVGVVARHPELRHHLPGRFAYKRAHPLALLALSGIVLALVRPRSLFAWLLTAALGRPYVRYRVTQGRLPARERHQPAVIAGALLADLVEIYALGRESWRRRTLLL